MTISNEDVQDILRLLDTLPFSELTLETSRFTLRLQRAADGGWSQETQVLSHPVAATPAAAAGPAPAGHPAPAAGPAPAGAPAAGGTQAGASPAQDVRAPLPGTFYRAPQPGAPPYVEVGSQVNTDTVVAIIETMKLMNPVYAGATGTVSEICLDDGQFAEQDAVLMRVSAPAG
ncbi:MAG TPA: biotin/lipoyl-containing protein [Streptosporangiaceae bacterium]